MRQIKENIKPFKVHWR